MELFLTGKSVGLKGYAFRRPGMEQRYGTYPPRAMAARTTNDLHLAWDVPYEPGTLRAVGMKDGKVVVEGEVATTEASARIELALDREKITLVPFRTFYLRDCTLYRGNRERMYEHSAPMKWRSCDEPVRACR